MQEHNPTSRLFDFQSVWDKHPRGHGTGTERAQSWLPAKSDDELHCSVYSKQCTADPEPGMLRKRQRLIVRCETSETEFTTVAGIAGKVNLQHRCLEDSLAKNELEGCPVATTAWPFIELDEAGVAFVQGTSTKVTEIVSCHLGYRWDADQIHRQLAGLSLAQIHAALGYYYEHQVVCDLQLQAAETQSEYLRSRFENSAVLEKLRSKPVT
jgi:uncharacterized protein (DUF433 family)